MRLYGDLANWFHLLTAPADYEVEAARYRDTLLEELPEAVTFLEARLGWRQQRLAPAGALHVHALRPLAADALAEQDAQPRLRARAR